ncbi:hypothetical protein QQS21_002749 [Conoideocrella luteorostrata]|uniref:Xylanolytic transcriptional activator regulatory domain-containing protein n=1 Tax=Conoideocrella luteorostrata TaxID=1105319 RepID=A0AAJ0CUQ4_9HYPO|nr:hypothetical protein QQS21_002749 [Conoideocrella luteorostrata]
MSMLSNCNDPEVAGPTAASSPSRKRLRPADHADDIARPRELGLMRETADPGAARFVGSSSGIHFVRAVYNRLSRSQRASAPRRPNIDLVPGEDDQLRQLPNNSDVLGSFWSHDEVRREMETVSGGGAPASFDDLLEWSNNYFEFWHPIYPFLHAPDVLQIFEAASHHGICSLSVPDANILKSVISISLADSRQGLPLKGRIPSSFVFDTADEAMSRCCIALSQPASMKVLQATLSIQTFLISMLYFNSASRLGGLAVRMVYHLGLHRCPSRYPMFSTAEISMRRRVFWSSYCLERLLAQSLGIPLDIQDDDTDVCYPGEEIHKSSCESSNEARKLVLLKHLAKHARIRGLIVELRHKSINNRQETATKSMYVQAELAKWSNDVQDDIEDEEGEDGNRNAEADPLISDRHRLLLDLLKNESTICLNRPLMALVADTPSYSSALQACISAARCISSAMRKHIGHNEFSGNNEDTQISTRLIEPLVWPSVTWAVWISAFVLVHATFNNQVALNTTLRHVKVCKDTLRHVSSRQTMWPEHCLEAIDALLIARQEIHSSLVAKSTQTQGANSNIELGEASHELRPEYSQYNVDETQSRRPSNNVSSGLFSSEYDFRTRTLSSNGDGTAQTVLKTPTQSIDIRMQMPTYQADASRPQITNNSELNNPPEDAAGFLQRADPLATMYPDNELADLQGSMVWYDQLFERAFTAIDNPSHVDAEYESSGVPTWSFPM